MISTHLTIRTPARLHFGLLGWGPGSARQFGGLGLMIRDPAIEITAESSTRMEVQGLLIERVERILSHLKDQLADERLSVPPMRIRIHQAPPEHVGLGVGTQLSLAIAAAVHRLEGLPVPAAADLARLTGRGLRSGIGLHGFQSGGLIVDGGRRKEDPLPPLIARLNFPDEWSILVIRPRSIRGLHGTEEIRAFRELPTIDSSLTNRLSRIVLLGVLPSVATAEIGDFGEAIEELQSHMGAIFAPAQGGAFTSPRAEEIIAECHRCGFTGCGQSSWGPVLYGFSDRPADEVRARTDQLIDRLGMNPDGVIVTGASNAGAEIHELQG